MKVRSRNAQNNRVTADGGSLGWPRQHNRHKLAVINLVSSGGRSCVHHRPFTASGLSSPIVLSILRDIQSNIICIVRNPGFGLFFEKSQLKPTSFGSQSVVEAPLRMLDKANTILQVYLPCLLKNICWILPFRKTPSSYDWRISSKIFGVCKDHFPPKSYTSHT